MHVSQRFQDFLRFSTQLVDKEAVAGGKLANLKRIKSDFETLIGL